MEARQEDAFNKMISGVQSRIGQEYDKEIKRQMYGPKYRPKYQSGPTRRYRMNTPEYKLHVLCKGMNKRTKHTLTKIVEDVPLYLSNLILSNMKKGQDLTSTLEVMNTIYTRTRTIISKNDYKSEKVDVLNAVNLTLEYIIMSRGEFDKLSYGDKIEYISTNMYRSLLLEKPPKYFTYLHMSLPASINSKYGVDISTHDMSQIISACIIFNYLCTELRPTIDPGIDNVI